MNYPKVHAITSPPAFRERLRELGADLPCDDAILKAPETPLAKSATLSGRTIGNRFAVQPMEGWDATRDGAPTERVYRRWRRFGASGAKLIWGGEAVAVRHDGRANPNQLVLDDSTELGIRYLREALADTHRTQFGRDDDLIVGLQLTHSGRFSCPDGSPKPLLVYRHPLLDRRLQPGVEPRIATDGEIRRLIASYGAAARRAQRCGFDFVDLKCCHGYFGHETLSAFTREGAYGGSFENRTRFLREVIAEVRERAPGLEIGVRLSAFDFVPFRPDPEQSEPGRPGPGLEEDYCDCMPYRYAFGVDHDQPKDISLDEPVRLLEMLEGMGVRLVNLTAGSPYYNPHIQRPAWYPPSDGYRPPEDPLVGVARQMFVTREIKRRLPGLIVVGTAYSYLQEYLPHVAQAAVREGWTDFVGLGRMMLSYHEMPRDVLEKGELRTKRLCRTFSDCTTAPRNGLPSGCYPLDPEYKLSEDAKRLREAKHPQP